MVNTDFTKAFLHFIHVRGEYNNYDWEFVESSCEYSWQFFSFNLKHRIIEEYVMRLLLSISTIYSLQLRIEVPNTSLLVTVMGQDEQISKFVEQWLPKE